MDTNRHSHEGQGLSAEETESLLGAVYDLLTKPKPPDLSTLPAHVCENATFTAICEHVQGIRNLSGELSKGELAGTANGRGMVISNLKRIQANLRHLTWQSKRIAQGDYSQTLDFLGEISESFNNMTQKLALATQRLVAQANLDALTGVFNRLALDQFLSTAFAQAKNGEGKLSILIMDIDHFKKINDTYGHLVGDEILKVVAKRLEKQTRASDCFARYGGEEFVGVLVDTDLEAAKRVCERMLSAVSLRPVVLEGQGAIPVTISIGASALLPGDAHYDNILSRSDAALYGAKQGGRNCYRVREEPVEAESV